MAPNGLQWRHHRAPTFCRKWPHWCSTGKDKKVGYKQSRCPAKHTSDFPKTSSIKLRAGLPESREGGEGGGEVQSTSGSSNVWRYTYENGWNRISPLMRPLSQLCPHPAMSQARATAQLDHKNQIHSRGEEMLERYVHASNPHALRSSSCRKNLKNGLGMAPNKGLWSVLAGWWRG